ncbi:MAG: iron uptake protein [Pseudomonadota bacterium]
MNLVGHLERVGESRTYRVLLAIFGGYAFTVGFFAFLSVLLAVAGTSHVEAMWWGVLTSFLVYTLVVLWAVATGRIWRTSLILVGGAVVMIAGAPLLAPQLGPV